MNSCVSQPRRGFAAPSRAKQLRTAFRRRREPSSTTQLYCKLFHARQSLRQGQTQYSALCASRSTTGVQVLRAWLECGQMAHAQRTGGRSIRTKIQEPSLFECRGCFGWAAFRSARRPLVFFLGQQWTPQAEVHGR